MDEIGWTLQAVVLLVTIVPGVIALSTGWVIPLGRRRGRTARLSGWGDICVGAGSTPVMGPIHRHLNATPFATTGTVVGLCVMLGGFALVLLARRTEGAR